MYYRQTLKAGYFERTAELWLAVVSAIVGGLGVWYVYSLGLVTSLTDAHAHLNFSKMLVDSLTPGVSQIGFWPPLLHLLMAPFAQVPFLYESGLAGAIVLIPFYILGTVLSYKLVRLLTDNAYLGLLAAALFMFNPYIVYYTASPMMEVMFLGNLIAVAYFLALWLYTGRLSSLVWTAVFVTLATLSRYEGMILIPLVGGVFLIELVKRNRKFQEMQAVLLLFLMVAVIGAFIILTYSWLFGGSPLAFTGGSWVRSAGAEDRLRTEHNLVDSLKYLLYASYYMLGKGAVLFALIAFPFVWLVSRNRLEKLSVLMVLASPVIFITFALYSGSYNIGVPDLSPGNFYLNERYGLTWVGFVIVAPLLLLGSVLQATRTTSYRWLRNAAVASSAVAAVLLVYLMADSAYTVAKTDKYFVVKDNINTPRFFQKDLAEYMQRSYDYGKILITRTDNDPMLDQAGMPLKNYIYEANYLYFDQALDEPWMFARWVIMHNPENIKDEWAAENERVAQKWHGNEQFDYFYELAYENSNRLVYRVRPERLEAHAKEHNLDLAKMPSYNRDLEKWDPQDFYSSVRVSVDVKKN